VEPVPREVRLYADAKGRSPFEVWLNGLRDLNARAIIRERIARLMLGNFGDAKAIGDGVFELRVTFGPGYRIYFAEDGKRIIVLLGGGSKRAQAKDIGRARICWNEYKRLIGHA
jgi:putative addiction module killer protein